ncbi:hypothetical protein [Lysobacter sp. CA199]|uniref:hypothetical protein n=1 Tax=Lysobacter sp. CA199 TaxID=3455608 RepID=UPI003F8D8C72
MDVRDTKRFPDLLPMMILGLGLFLLFVAVLVVGLLAIQAFGYETAIVKCDGARLFKNGQVAKNSHVEMTYTRYTSVVKLWEDGFGTLDVRGVDPVGFLELWGTEDNLSLYERVYLPEITMVGTYSIKTGDMQVNFVDGIHGNDFKYVAKCDLT